MNGVDLEQLLDRIEAAARRYHRLILVVGPADSGKTRTLQALGHRLSSRIHNVNRIVSQALLEVSRHRRPFAAQRALVDPVKGEDPVVLDNLEILSDPELRQDPLRLLQQMSRNRTVVASWNGSLAGDHLTYAEPWHHEHHAYPEPDAIIVQPATQDSAAPGESRAEP